MIGLGVMGLLALLFILARTTLRERLVPLPSPKVPASGAAPWSRTPVSARPSGLFHFTQQGNAMFNAPNTAPFTTSFNAAPTIANAPSNPQSNSTAPGGPRPLFTLPTTSLPARPIAQSDAWLLGETQSQPFLPTTSPLIPKVQAAYGENQPEQSTNPAPPDDPFTGANKPVDSSNNGARKRLRRNNLPTTGKEIAFPEQISGEPSADMMIVSNPYLRITLKQYSQRGQTAKQAPEESS